MLFDEALDFGAFSPAVFAAAVCAHVALFAAMPASFEG